MDLFRALASEHFLFLLVAFSGWDNFYNGIPFRLGLRRFVVRFRRFDGISPQWRF